MTKFGFAALALAAIIWGITGVLRQSPPEQLAMEETGPESGGSITETGAPGWWVTPAHLRMGPSPSGCRSAGHRPGEPEAAI